MLISLLLVLQLLEQIQRAHAGAGDVMALVLLLLDIDVAGDSKRGRGRDGPLELVDVDGRLAGWGGGAR